MENKEFRKITCEVDGNQTRIKSSRINYDDENKLIQISCEHSFVMGNISHTVIDRVNFIDVSFLKTLETDNKVVINSRGIISSEDRYFDGNQNSYLNRNETKIEKDFSCKIELKNGQIEPFDLKIT